MNLHVGQWVVDDRTSVCFQFLGAIITVRIAAAPRDIALKSTQLSCVSVCVCVLD